MKVALDHQIFCIQAYGGISRYYTHLVEKSHIKGADIKAFAPYHRNKYLASLPKGLVHGNSLNTYPPKTTRLALLLNAMVAKHAIKKWRPEIVHETYYSHKSISPSHCPVIITVYDMVHELFPNDFPPANSTTNNKRISVNRADHVICISDSTRKDLIEIFDVPKEKTSVVHLGFEHFYREHSYIPHSDIPTKNFLLYVGGRQGYKNFAGFIKSVAASSRLLSDFKIVAFGGGGFTNGEKHLIQKLGFKDGQIIQISGDDDILSELYDKTSALIYPSLYEGFGLPPLEAMAHNCPVISSNTSSMPEVIKNAGEFFNPSSIEEMTTAIENVLYSDTRAATIIALGKDRLKKFSWEKCAIDTLAIYQKVLDEKQH